MWCAAVVDGGAGWSSNREALGRSLFLSAGGGWENPAAYARFDFILVLVIVAQDTSDPGFLNLVEEIAPGTTMRYLSGMQMRNEGSSGRAGRGGRGFGGGGMDTGGYGGGGYNQQSTRPPPQQHQHQHHQQQQHGHSRPAASGGGAYNAYGQMGGAGAPAGGYNRGDGRGSGTQWRGGSGGRYPPY